MSLMDWVAIQQIYPLLWTSHLSILLSLPSRHTQAYRTSPIPSPTEQCSDVVALRQSLGTGKTKEASAGWLRSKIKDHAGVVGRSPPLRLSRLKSASNKDIGTSAQKVIFEMVSKYPKGKLPLISAMGTQQLPHWTGS